jgi:hypothetical protein
MAYDQSGQYGAPPRGYHNQQAPRGGPRQVLREPPRAQPYADQYNGYGQEGAGYQHSQHEAYHGYDRESFWNEYGADTSGYDQQYQQADYGPPQNYQGYNNAPQQRRPSREQMQRREDYAPRARGYGNGMSGPMGPAQGGRGRGPPQNYPPRNYGPPRGAMQQYDGRRPMGGPQSDSPPRQKREFIQFCLYDQCT